MHEAPLFGERVEEDVVEGGQSFLEREVLVPLGGRGEEAVLVDDEVVECRVEVGGRVEVDVERCPVEAGLGTDRRDRRGILGRADLQGRLDELFLLREVVGIGNGGGRGVWHTSGTGCSAGRAV